MPTRPSSPTVDVLPGIPEGGRRPTPLLDLGPLGKMWTALILETLHGEGGSSFGLLQKIDPGLTRRALSRRLLELRREGYITRIIVQERPRRTSYRLTDKGARALPLLRAMGELLHGAGEPPAPPPTREGAEALVRADPSPPRGVPALLWTHPPPPRGWSSASAPGVALSVADPGVTLSSAARGKSNYWDSQRERPPSPPARKRPGRN